METSLVLSRPISSVSVGILLKCLVILAALFSCQIEILLNTTIRFHSVLGIASYVIIFYNLLYKSIVSEFKLHGD